MMIDGFECMQRTYDAMTYPVYRAGRGHAVIVMHEMPFLHDGVIAFAKRVVDAGYTVYMPSLFGSPGPLTPARSVASMARACISKEFTLLATRKTSRITHWLRALTREAHAACGGPGVGAVGMCFTGGFALAMMVDESIVAPVLSQPSIPLPLTRAMRRDLGVSDEDLAVIKQRDTCVMGLRFTNDRLVPDERFARLREELGDRFIAVEIDSKPGNAHGIPSRAHSVLSFDYVDTPGHPTHDALGRVMTFFAERLA